MKSITMVVGTALYEVTASNRVLAFASDMHFFELMTQAETWFISNTNEHCRQRVRSGSPGNDSSHQEIHRNLYAAAHTWAKSNPILQRKHGRQETDWSRLDPNRLQTSPKKLSRAPRFHLPGVWEYEIEANTSTNSSGNWSSGFCLHPPSLPVGNTANVVQVLSSKTINSARTVTWFDGCWSGICQLQQRHDPYRTCERSSPKRQKDIYNAVLRVKNAATQTIGSWSIVEGIICGSARSMTSELWGLGLLIKPMFRTKTWLARL